jgi:CO/xanthine dehydrogenase FAD-binding subunit
MRAHLPDFELVVATDLPAALTLLADSETWRPVAGGTDLMVLFNAGRLPYRKLVSIAALREMKEITVTPDSIALGAGVTYSAIQRHPILQSEFPLLCQAANWTGSPANQNRGTIGGNIANASPAADTPPALLVYDAELELISHKGSRRISYHQFHTGYKTMLLRPDELISKIHLPTQPAHPLKQYARKVGTRKAQAISKVCFNAVAEIDSSVIRLVRIGLGSVAPVPLRCYKVEASLTGQSLTPALIAHARELIAQEIKPIDDIRSTSQYRSLVTQNLLAEFLGQLL